MPKQVIKAHSFLFSDEDDEQEEAKPRKAVPKVAVVDDEDDDFLNTPAKPAANISWDEDDETPAPPKKKKNPLYQPEVFEDEDADEDTDLDDEEELPSLDNKAATKDEVQEEIPDIPGAEYETITKAKWGFTYLRRGDKITEPDGKVRIIQKDGGVHAPVGSVIRKRVQPLAKGSQYSIKSRERKKAEAAAAKNAKNSPHRPFDYRRAVYYPKGLDDVPAVTPDEVAEVKSMGGGTAALRSYFEDEGAAAVIKFLRTLEKSDPVNFLKKYKEFAPFFMAKVATEDIKKIRAMDKAEASGTTSVSSASKPIVTHTITVKDFRTNQSYQI